MIFQNQLADGKSTFPQKIYSDILTEAEAGAGDSHAIGLKRVLGVRDLTFFGIAAVIGAGIFSSIGKAVFNGGPGVVFLYIFTAIACGFAAFCYAEFASTVPVSGSANLFLCCFRGIVCLDHWLGSDHGICDRQYCCCNFAGVIILQI